LKEGDLFWLEELCDDLVEIRVNRVLVGRGEVVVAGGKFGMKIESTIAMLSVKSVKSNLKKTT
jgi:flagellar motor switch/type III secretory pathway protein FliN